jgi:hypothetical protein
MPGASAKVRSDRAQDPAYRPAHSCQTPNSSVRLVSYMSVSDDLTSMPITVVMPANCEGSRYGLVRWGELDLDMLGMSCQLSPSIIRASICPG